MSTTGLDASAHEPVAQPSSRTCGGNLIFFNARTQYENLGDLIINRILLTELRRYGRLIVDTRGVPDWYCAQLNITAEETHDPLKSRFSALPVRKGVRRRLGLDPGQTYLIGLPGHDFGDVRDPLASFKMLLWHLFYRLSGVRVCRFGASIGPFSKGRRVLEYLQSKLMYAYTVRDTLSEQYAQDLGISRVKLFPDLAWLMPRPESSSRASQAGTYAVLSFRPSAHRDDRSAADYRHKLFTALDEVVAQLCDGSRELVISYQVTYDRACCLEIFQRYEGRYPVRFIDARLDTQEGMCALYAGASAVISNRLHVLLFGMRCGAIPVALIDSGKQSKVTGILADAGLSQVVVDISKSDKPIGDRLSAIMGDAKSVRQTIDRCFTDYALAASDLLRDYMQ